jgi:hypothetical protein
MGLLDDAIRQHLDLKRQHGADESELRRKEDEALGPARREAPAADQAPVEPASEPPAAEPPAEELEDVYPVEEAHLPPGEEALEPATEAPAEVPVEELVESEELAMEDFEADEPDLREPPERPGSVALGRLEEDEPLREDGPLPEAAPPEEDVLEETPEFLQETPEHDRLWFEQKPPRDFDLDDE